MSIKSSTVFPLTSFILLPLAVLCAFKSLHQLFSYLNTRHRHLFSYLLQMPDVNCQKGIVEAPNVPPSALYTDYHTLGNNYISPYGSVHLKIVAHHLPAFLFLIHLVKYIHQSFKFPLICTQSHSIPLQDLRHHQLYNYLH